MSYAKYRALIALPYPNAAGSDASATQAAALDMPPTEAAANLGAARTDVLQTVAPTASGGTDPLSDYIHEIFVGHSKLHEEFPRGFDPVQFYTDIIEMPLMLRRA